MEIGGTVEDDARIAGQALLLSEDAELGDDLVAASLSLENEPGSTVGGTVMYAGYQALLAGTVEEDVEVAANALELDGRVGGDVDVEVDGEDDGPPPSMFAPAPQVQIPPVESGLTLTDSAQIEGNLTYESGAEARISPDAQIEGEVIREERPPEEDPTRNPVVDRLLESLRSLLALLLVGLLLMWVVPNWTRRLADAIQARPLASLGWGVLGFIVFIALTIAILLATVLLAVIFGLITLGGMVLLIISLGVFAEAVLVLAFLISVGYLAQIVVSFLVGRLLLGRVQPNRASDRVLPLVIGLVLYAILTAIPVLDFIVGLVVVLLGLGAISNWIWTTLFRSRSTQEPPPPG